VKALTWLNGQLSVFETRPRLVQLQFDGSASHLIVQIESKRVESMSFHFDKWCLNPWNYCAIHLPAAAGTLHWIARANA